MTNEQNQEEREEQRKNNLHNLDNQKLSSLVATSLIDSKDPRTQSHEYGSLVRDLVWQTTPDITDIKVKTHFGEDKDLLSYIEDNPRFDIRGDIPKPYIASKAAGMTFGALNASSVGDILSRIGIEGINLKEDLKEKSIKELGNQEEHKKTIGTLKYFYRENLTNTKISEAFDTSAKNVAGGLEDILKTIQEKLPSQEENQEGEEEVKEKEFLEAKRKVGLLNLESDVKNIGIYGEIESNVGAYGEAMKEKVGSVISSFYGDSFEYKDIESEKEISIEQRLTQKTMEQGFERGAISRGGLAEVCSNITRESISTLKVKDILSGMQEDLPEGGYSFLSDEIKDSYIRDLMKEDSPDEVKEMTGNLVGMYQAYINQKGISSSMSLYNENLKTSMKSRLEDSTIANKPQAADNLDYTNNAKQAAA